MNEVLVKKNIFPPAAGVRMSAPAALFAEVKTEIIRKSIHMLIALVPGMAAVHYRLTVFLLIIGILSYVIMEQLRLYGVTIPVVSALTGMASRRREADGFVLGPVTLGIGALLIVLFFPLPAASIAIYALAFGDGLAALVGKLFGKIRPAFLLGKSVEGSMTCFAATYIVAWMVSQNYIVALSAAIAATAVEGLPLKDYDNIALPLVVALVVQHAMS